MRGKVCWNWSRWSVDGITPAYAGKRYIFKGLLCGFKDHPRLCGEKCAEPSIVVTIQGSPPPMRGKVVRAIPDILRKRITPAYAGKSDCEDTSQATKWDHPRLCGEKHRRDFPTVPILGSPPPLRGKVFASKSKQDGFRITPAYAGKSLRCRLLSFYFEDHPRLCGEKLQRLGQNRHIKGSPPPMRGKASSKPSGYRSRRITPAYAGKSSKLLSFSLPDQDHPRLCGEKSTKRRNSEKSRGSPPPMRGKVQNMSMGNGNWGITPAYAGKSGAFRKSFYVI